MPCCFKDWNKPAQVKRRKECGVTYKDEELPKKEESTKKYVKSKLTEEYVKEPTKFPLDKGVKGFLPLSVQKILNTHNDNCKISKKDKNLKPNHPCLLRKGIEFNKNQSFIECLADIYKNFI